MGVGSKLLLLSPLVLASGCATVTRGTHQDFHILSRPPGADVRLSSGESCVTPCMLKLRREDSLIIKISKPNYVTQTVKVTSKLSAGGGVIVVGNALIGGVMGAAVDSSNGSMHDLTPNPVDVQLIPVAATADQPGVEAIPASPTTGAALESTKDKASHQ